MYAPVVMNILKCPCDVLSDSSASDIALMVRSFLKLVGIHPQIRPFDIVHGVERLLVMLPMIINLNNIGVVKAEELLNLLVEAIQCRGMGLCEPL